MPKAHPMAVRQLAQALWLQGIRPTQIAETTGVTTALVCKWANIHGWTQQLQESKQSLEAKLNTHVTKDLAVKSIQLKESISTELERIGSALANTKTKRNLEHLKKRAQVIESTVSSASKLFGWDAEVGRSPVNVSVLTLNVPHGTKPVAELESNPVIDIQPAKDTQESNPDQVTQDTKVILDSAQSVAQPSESTTSIQADKPQQAQPIKETMKIETNLKMLRNKANNLSKLGLAKSAYRQFKLLEKAKEHALKNGCTLEDIARWIGK